MGRNHQVEVDGKTPLMSPDIGEPLHRIAGVAKDDPLQKMSSPWSKLLREDFNQMAAVGGKMGLHMGHLDGCAHET